MSQFVYRCLATACSALTATAFAQQPAPAAVRPPVADAAPSSVYRSAWSGYRPFADEKVISWKDANDEVRRIGGWRTYLRESQGQPSGSAGAATEGAAKPQEHDSHNKPRESR